MRESVWARGRACVGACGRACGRTRGWACERACERTRVYVVHVWQQMARKQNSWHWHVFTSSVEIRRYDMETIDYDNLNHL